MLEILLVIIAAYGITNIVTQGTIFDPIKERVRNFIFGKKLFYLLNCHMCFGFWVGLSLGVFYGPFESWNVLLNGAFYSATCWIIHCVTAFLGSGQDPERDININFPYGITINKEDASEEDEEDINKKEVLYEELKETN